MGKRKIKRLGRKIPGERLLIKSNDLDYEFEEVRTCYDNPRFLPKYEDNEDDEDLSDCPRLRRKTKNELAQMQCDSANAYRQQQEEAEERAKIMKGDKK